MKTLHNPAIAYRPDIDGLRSLAVMPVVLFHIGGLALVKGGFVGVDVFFVISGFLITRIIHKEIFVTENFSIIRFYHRRVRRILPAVIPVYIFSTVLSIIYYFPGEQMVVAKSIWASSSFLSNIYFYWTTDYFDETARISPLLHTWSLSVEEQFYFIIPPLMILVARWQRTRHMRLERYMLAVIAVVSLSAATLLLSRYASAVFYLIPFRAWELLAGSLVGIGAIPLWRSRVMAEASVLAGIALITLSVVLLDSSMPFPGLAALPSVLGSTLVIHAGVSHPATLGARLLGLWPLRFIGLCSYSIYLWHWPLVVFFPYAVGEYSMLMRIGILVVSVLAGIASWAFIERPLRQGDLLAQPKKAFVLVGGATAAAALFALMAPIIAAIVRPLPPTATRLLTQQHDASRTWRVGQCFLNNDAADFTKFDRGTCFHIDPARTNVMLVGDSHAAQLYPGLIAIDRINVLQGTASGCRPVSDGYAARRCRKVVDTVFNQVLVPGSKVSTVLIAARWRSNDAASLTRRINELTQLGFEVVVAGPAPEWTQPLPRILAMQALDPALDLSIYQARKPFETEKQIAAAVAQTKARYISVIQILCPDSHCRTITPNGQVMQFDYGHLTPDGARYVIQQARLRF